jgi:two-component SAPR family response regulator
MKPAAQVDRRSPTPQGGLPASQGVVIVDDDIPYVELLTKLLTRSLCCPIHAFTSSLEALAALPAIDAALVVTDYSMPQLNGIEFILEANKLKPELAYILMTGHPWRLTDESLAKLPNLKSVLSKPFNWHRLNTEIALYWPPGTRAALREPAAGQFLFR